MLFGNTKCKPISSGFEPPVETFQKVDSAGHVIRLECTPSELAKVDPVADIETNLEVLFAAGISPERVSVSGLLNPSDPVRLEEYAIDKLSQIAKSVPRETTSVNENNSQNFNSNANE